MKTLIAFIALAVLGTRSVLNLKEDYSRFALRRTGCPRSDHEAAVEQRGE